MRAHHRREIAAKQQKVVRIRGLSQKGDHRVVYVVKVNPFETRVMEIHLVERGLRMIETVQLAYEILQLAVKIELDQLPADARRIVPLFVLPDFRAHEQQ